MKILVTGASGFVGQHAVRTLLGARHDVVGATEDGRGPQEIETRRLDVRDEHVVVRTLEQVGPDAVLHLAAIAFVPDAQKNPRFAFDINAVGTLNLLHAARVVTPDARVVVISSAEVYGPVADPEEMPLVEDRVLRPATHYGAGKAAAEHVARVFALEGQDVVVLRPFNHIGPGQRDDFVVPSFARQVARLEAGDGDGVLRHGNLDAVRDFLDVRDVVAAYERALTAARGVLEPGRPYNLCSGRGVKIAEIVSHLVGRSRRPIETEVDPARLRKIDVPVYVGSADRLRAAIGFEPAFTLERTLDDVLDEARRAIAG